MNKFFQIKNTIFTTGAGAILLTCFFLACDPPATQPSETNPPEISIYDPDSFGIIKNGDTLAITGNISDDTQLNSLLIRILGMQGQLYYEYNPSVQNLTTYNINTQWLVNGIPYDTLGYLDVVVTDVNTNYAYKHWTMRLRN